MKVRIQYTVEIEDIPQEVDGLVKKALCQLADASDTVNSLDAGGNFSKFLEMVESARSQALKADMLLDDCSKIISDYAAAIHAASEGEENEESR